MRPMSELISFARAARAMLAGESDLAQFEIYCASTDHLVARLNYTSDLPSRGVEELKSHNADGLAIRIVMRRDGREAGFASEAGGFSLEALRAALANARSAAVVDPDSPGLPRTPRKLARLAISSREPALANREALIDAAWAIVGGAVAAFESAPDMVKTEPGLVVGGDISVMCDRMALASSAFEDIRADQGTHFTASVTALVESLGAKGTAHALGASPIEMRRAADALGRDAVANALATRTGERPASGTYRIMLAAQPVAEILNYMVIPSLTTGAFHAASSAYHGRFGARVMDERIAISDVPIGAGRAIARRITCEGLPTRRTTLIRDGRLIGLLSNFYDSHRLKTDPTRADKLGPGGDKARAFLPGSGYRLGENGARRFDSHPGSSPTNVVMRARGAVSERDLIRRIGDGIYVGRVWYTYPINGQRAGDFTCTISGDSWVVRGGRRAASLAPNCLRINANIAQILERPLGIGRTVAPALVWGAPEAYYVPALAVQQIALGAIEEPST